MNTFKKKNTKINQFSASKISYTEAHKQLTFNQMHCHILLCNVYFFLIRIFNYSNSIKTVELFF